MRARKVRTLFMENGVSNYGELNFSDSELGE